MSMYAYERTDVVFYMFVRHTFYPLLPTFVHRTFDLQYEVLLTDSRPVI